MPHRPAEPNALHATFVKNLKGSHTPKSDLTKSTPARES
jgi:hypothetical protein